eukprot:s1967_g8.t1
MSSSENDGLSSEYVDSDEIHRQDLLHSSDFERSSESAHIDDNSEDIMSAGSSGGRELESAELWSNQTRNPVRFLFYSTYGQYQSCFSANQEYFKRAGEPRRWKSIDIEDVPAVVQVSFNCGTFQARGARWKQHDGTCIGSQISPILSSLPVLCTEIGWQRLFASCNLLNESFIVRYVDNRLIITSHEFTDSLAIRLLVSPLFYGAPIELEDVGDGAHRRSGAWQLLNMQTALPMILEKVTELSALPWFGTWAYSCLAAGGDVQAKGKGDGGKAKGMDVGYKGGTMGGYNGYKGGEHRHVIDSCFGHASQSG